MQKKKYNNILYLLRLYFVNSGAKKQLIDTLLIIGLYTLYIVVYETIGEFKISSI